MANTTSSQTLFDGSTEKAVKVTLQSDATNETDVVKVDASALGIDTTWRVDRIEWTTVNSTSDHDYLIEWDGDTDAPICVLPPNDSGCLDFTKVGGCQNNATTPTGDITVTATLDAGDAYTIVFYLAR